MCLYIISMGFTALKKSFLSFLVCDSASEDSQNPFRGQNIFVFKVPFVGTLNLCLQIPDTEQMTRTQFNHLGLRKRQKTGKNTNFWFCANFSSFWTFSRPMWIELSSGLLLCVRHLETQV